MTILFIGYGSLLSHESIAHTIPDREIKPVIIEGYKRIFNVDLSPHTDDNLDVLNVTKSDQHIFNAVLMEISEEELEKLQIREFHYTFEKVIAKDFLTQEVYENCLLSVDHNRDIDKGKKLPKKPYFILCRNAAYKISEEFGVMWDETTYTAQGEKITEFLKHNPDFLCSE